MRKGGGHSKGAHFERVTAKQIVKAFKNFGIKQRECWRSVMSGGHATMSCGDLEMSDRLWKLFPYSVECKHRKKINLANFMMADGKSEERKWVKQVLDGVKKSRGLRALLVIKANRVKTLAIREVAPMPGFNFLLPSDGLRMNGRTWEVLNWNKFLKVALEEARKKKNVR